MSTENIITTIVFTGAPAAVFINNDPVLRWSPIERLQRLQERLQESPTSANTSATLDAALTLLETIVGFPDHS